MSNSEVACCTLRETREGLAMWPRPPALGKFAEEDIYIQLTVNYLINPCTDPGRLLTFWIQGEAFLKWIGGV